MIDALLFVFGFKAKKMRQEKLSGLIHESRDHHAQQCMVEIYFHSIVEDAVTGASVFSVHGHLWHVL